MNKLFNLVFGLFFTVLAGMIAGCYRSSGPVPPTAVVVDAGTSGAPLSLAPGTTWALRARAQIATDQVLDITASATWTATGSATVSSSGVVTATGPGTATVTATLSGVSGSTTLTVTNATLAGLAVLPQERSAPMGLAIPYQAVATFSDGSTQDLTGQVAWTATPGTGAATITAGTGQVVGTGAGQVAIQAAWGGQVSAPAGLTVTGAAPVALEVTSVNEQPEVIVGTTRHYLATATYDDGSREDVTGQTTMASSNGNAAFNTPADPGAATILGGGAFQVNARFGQLTAGLPQGGPGTLAAGPQALGEASPGGGAVPASVAGYATITLDIVPPRTINAGTPADFRLERRWVWKTLVGDGVYSTRTITEDMTRESSTTWSVRDASGKILSDMNSTRLVFPKGGQYTVMARMVDRTEASLAVTAIELPMTGLVVVPANPVLIAGQTGQQMRALLVMRDGTSQDVTDQVDWAVVPDVPDTPPACLITGNKSPLPRGFLSATGSSPGFTIRARISEFFTGLTFSAETRGRSEVMADLVTTAVTTNPDRTTVPLGIPVFYYLKGTFKDGTVLDLAPLAGWSIRNAAGGVTAGATPLVTIDGYQPSNIRVTGRAQGQVQVAADLPAGMGAADALLHRAAPLTITAGTLQNVTILRTADPTSAQADVGATVTFTLQGTYSDGSTVDLTQQADWDVETGQTLAEMQDPETVGGRGVVQTLALGTATVRAQYQYGRFQSRYSLEIVARRLTAVDLQPDLSTAPAGSTLVWKAVARYSDGSAEDITRDAVWWTSNLAVALADPVNRGQIWASSAGTADFTVYYQGMASAPVRLTVTKP